MQKRNSNSSLIISLLFLFLISGCHNQPHPAQDIILNSLFTNNMVLQQKQEIPIWGKAAPGGEVVVSLNEQQKKAIVDTAGNWKVSLSPVSAGGPYKLVISGEETTSIENVMVGEVWICSGQSNMEMPVSGSWAKVMNDKEEVANANYPDIRLFMVDKVMANTPQEKFGSNGWKECSAETISEFSAVAYFFGRNLYKKLNVPIGLIQTAWGGTLVEAWTSGETLKKMPDFTAAVEAIESDTATKEEKAIANKKRLAVWPDKIEQILKNKGTFGHGYQNMEYKTDNWKTMKLPTLWEDVDLNIDGVVWFSKEVNIPESWKGEELTLSLGKINDYDITWFNGERVGRGTDVSESRTYKIPSSFVESGKNRIVVQVLDVGNVGGLYGPAKEMKLTAGDKSVSLVGNWEYKIDPIKIDPKDLLEKPNDNSGVNRPTVLYNAMINPLLPYGIKGAIWYQGESNAGRAYQYRTLFSSMIKDWRNVWNQGDFPFLFVQLANFMKVKPLPVDDAWAELREAQTMALELPNTGMAVTIDIGNAKNIHPTNKQEVGRRLALNALAKVYRKDIPYSGPMYNSFNVESDKVHIQFTNTDNGLKILGSEKLKGFAIAGEDKKFVWAEAKIEGGEVVVWNPKIKNPVAVRYAWAANPVCNLSNGADLPASPFRTDDRQGITFGKNKKRFNSN
ncbi:MAG: sialate O-acetylesterase [Draconibacterium sp.]|nr:sialate O-acetylesterase [Draconibacterium sp.]